MLDEPKSVHHFQTAFLQDLNNPESVVFSTIFKQNLIRYLSLQFYSIVMRSVGLPTIDNSLCISRQPMKLKTAVLFRALS